MTPFLKRAGFGELLLASPGSGGGGYWSIPPEIRDIIQSGVATAPPAKKFATDQEWIEWFCEGSATASTALPPPPALVVSTQINELTLTTLKDAIKKHEPELAFSDRLLASIVAALRAGDGKNFIILRGVSGTGKSRLVAAVAKAVYGAGIVDRPYLTVLEVRPDWTDGAPLLGHFDPVGQQYVREKFLDALMAAQGSFAPVFVCLDEMNLARVEYYLADCLSAMESGNPITLDVRGDTSLPRDLVWPKTLFLFGTINVDESTLGISDKVLDRAQVIDTSDIDLLPRLQVWLDSAPALDSAERELILSILGGVWATLRVVDAHFGYRTARAMVRFIEEAKLSSDGILAVPKALDAQLCQKVLVKVRGEGDRWIEPLANLEKTCIALEPDCDAIKVIARMRRDLERLGSFQFWN